MFDRLKSVEDEFVSLEASLSDPDIVNDQAKMRQVTRRYKDLTPVVDCVRRYHARTADAQAARELDNNSVDSSLILFSMWTETIRQMAENGKGNVFFLDGSPEGMQRQMRDLMAMQQLDVVRDQPTS